MTWSVGTHNTLCDVAGITVGHADDPAICSGATVVLLPPGTRAAVDVRGGGPGTRETDALGPLGSVDEIHGLVLAGGSAFGLAAAGPVQDALAARGIGYRVGEATVPIVPAAILFDLLNGPAKPPHLSHVYADLGAAAFAAVSGQCAVGSVGAGMGAQTALYRGGLGAASAQDRQTGVTVAALAVVNPFGCVTVPGTPHFLAAHYEQIFAGQPEFGGAGGWQGPPGTYPEAVTRFSRPAVTPTPDSPLPSNTTLVVVATNLAVDRAALGRIAAMAHTGMGRAIAPVHSPHDGDLVFALSTGEIDPAGPMSSAQPGALAGVGDCAAQVTARAIARGVYMAAPAPAGIDLPSYRSRWGSG
ncbi:MAG: P1 family peptidase [Pseudomonadota bacterium]